MWLFFAYFVALIDSFDLRFAILMVQWAPHLASLWVYNPHRDAMALYRTVQLPNGYGTLTWLLLLRQRRLQIVLRLRSSILAYNLASMRFKLLNLHVLVVVASQMLVTWSMYTLHGRAVRHQVLVQLCSVELILSITNTLVLSLHYLD